MPYEPTGTSTRPLPWDLSRGNLVRILLVGTAMLVVALVGLTGGASTDSTATGTITAVRPAAQKGADRCEADVLYAPAQQHVTARVSGRATTDCDAAVGTAVRVRYRSSDPDVGYVDDPHYLAWVLLVAGNLTVCVAWSALVTQESRRLL